MDFNDLILKRRSVRSFIKKEIPDNIIFDAINDLWKIAKYHVFI